MEEIMGLCADDTFGEICEKLLEFGLDENQLEDVKDLINEYADEMLEEAAAAEAEGEEL
jgi:hypothetical protein